MSPFTPERTRRGVDPRRQLLAVAIVIGCALGAVVNVHLAFGAGKGGMDLNQFYAASRLAGTGHLYDSGALRALEEENGPSIHSGRLPIVSYGVKAISWMPFPLALLVWRTASVAALLIVCAVWPGASRLGLLVALSWSTPAIYLISLGQDVAFWLLFFALGVKLLDRGYARLAGVAFALCLCKYHLAVGIPIMLIAQKRWKTLTTGGVVTLALLGTSFVIEGLSWPFGYVRTLSSPDFSPGIDLMPNLRGLASRSPHATMVELVAATGVVVLLWLACRRISSVGVAGAAAASCGLILGHHGYIQDCTILIPLAVLTIQSRQTALWLRALGLVLVTPALSLLLVMGAPLVGQTLLIGFVALTLARASILANPEGSEKASGLQEG